MIPSSGVSSEARAAIETAKKKLQKLLQETTLPKEYDDILWQVAAEVEYASAIISLYRGFEDFDPILDKRKSRKPACPAEDSLKESLRLIDESLKKLETDIRASYTNLKLALSLLRSVKSPKP